MDKKNFLEQKYCEINQLKNLLQTYPKEYCETIIKVMEKIFDEIADYLEDEKNKLKKSVKKNNRQREFTTEELSIYNGQNGNPAYVALNGKVYDMSGVPKWANGNHFGIMAGKVVDKQFKQCHSDNLSIIERAEEVGVLVNSNARYDQKYDKSNRDELRYYTIEEVSKFDGRGGTLAYVVIDGTVYDVTSMKQWINGNHYGLSAGKDLSEYFKTCHKNELEILKKLRIVGTIKVN